MTNYGRRRAIRLDVDTDKCALRYAAGACTAGTDVASGTSQTGATANTIKLAAGASAVDDFYNGYAITLADGRRNIITDYDGTTKIATVKYPWLLNMFTRPQEFDHADWTGVGTGSVLADQGAGADGTLTADEVTDSDAAARYEKLQQFTVANDTQDYVLSLYVRAGTETVVRLRTRFTGGTSIDAQTYFDIANLTTLYTPGHTTYGIESIQDDLYRVWAIVANNGTGNTTLQGSLAMGALNSDQNTMQWHGAQLEPSSALRDYVNGGSLACNYPDSVAYRIVEVGGECYNTFKTCQDIANYELGAKRWKFGKDGPDWPVDAEPRPYILTEDIAPMEIDLENGLAVRGAATITMRDEAGTDYEADPYYETRAEPASGTFWSRWVARNHNYSGRPALLHWAYLTDGYDETLFSEERYIVDNVDGPDGNGVVKFTFKDMTKLADREQVPQPTEGKITAALAIDGLSVTLETGQGALYSATGYIRIGDEVIQYNGNASDVLSWTDTTYRAQFGTTAEAHDAGDGVQQCKVYQNARVYDVLNDLLLESGLAQKYIDYAGFQTEDTDWLGPGFAITTCISEPEIVSKLLKEILIQTGAYLFWHPIEQLAKMAVIAPIAPGAGVVGTLTDEANIIENSASVEKLDDRRITRNAIYYDRRSATNDLTKGSSYAVAEVVIDVAAESTLEYGDVRSETHYSRWFTSANAPSVKAATSRRTARYRDAPQRITLRVDPKDATIDVGDLVDVTMRQIVGFSGKPETIRCLVTLKKDEGGRYRYRLRGTTLGKRYAFIAPSGAGDYPSDSDYAHIVNGTTLKFSDGTGPYYIF